MAYKLLVGFVAQFLLLGLVSGTQAATLLRTSSYCFADTYAWISGVGTDTDSGSGSFSATESSLVQDFNDPYVNPGESYSTTNALVTPTGSTAQVARVTGSTDTSSYLGGGYVKNGVWHVGTTQSFVGAAETGNSVTVAGTLSHNVSFSLDVQANNAAGALSAWARAGNVEVYFSWSGGSSMNVQEYVSGTMTANYNINAQSGLFIYDKSFSQTVVVGDVVEVDAYGVLTDNNNFQNTVKSLFIQAGTQ